MPSFFTFNVTYTAKKKKYPKSLNYSIPCGSGLLKRFEVNSKTNLKTPRHLSMVLAASHYEAASLQLELGL